MTKTKQPSYLIFHLIFWIICYIFLALIILLFSKVVDKPEAVPVFSITLSALILSMLQGFAFNFIERVTDRSFFRTQSLIVIIICRASIYIFTTALILLIFKTYISDHIRQVFNSDHLGPEEAFDSWNYAFYLVLLYNFMMAVINGFIVQVSKKFAPGIMMPLLLGKYRLPSAQKRVVLFMDLESSTTIAENLGHIKYSSFIRDCFFDINLVASTYGGQIYQYVGDEVVLTWNGENQDGFVNCIRLFFACESQFRIRHSYYNKQYSIIPRFRAGAHVGPITVVEIGEIKRDIAYHGDTMNTAARLQSLCSEYGQHMLISADLANSIYDTSFCINSLGIVTLKGKSLTSEIFSVSKI